MKRSSDAEVKERAQKCLDRLLAARGPEVPYDAMAELIELGREHALVRARLFVEMRTQLRNPDRDMALAWLMVVAGEMGPQGLEMLIELLGETESDDVMESAWPALTRHAVEVYGAITQTIDESRVTEQRGMLYEALRGAVLLGDDALKADLLAFARRRVRRELKMAVQERDVIGPLRLVVYLDAPDAREWLDRARERIDDTEILSLQEVESYLAGNRDEHHEITRRILTDTWRGTAENLRRLFHPTQEEERRLRELTARLGGGDGKLH